MKVIKFSVIMAKLKADGWYVDRQRGSHKQYKHPTKKGVVTINGKPSDDAWGRLLANIETQSELKF